MEQKRTKGKNKSRQKTWAEKFATPKQAEVKRIEKAFADMPEGAMMLIATPQIIEDYIRQIPKGKKVNLKTLRNDLALTYNAEYTCPVTTGIFLRIVAELNYEQFQTGKPLEEIAPFWRVISAEMPLANKLSFSKDFLAKD
ncbi:MAG: hypothetical protein EAZ55_12585 [Cytophagales bacterium]|nr:MAG: hypothetical protein EAZ55_12585 [Cytophagales bacterium]